MQDSVMVHVNSSSEHRAVCVWWVSEYVSVCAYIPY